MAEEKQTPEQKEQETLMAAMGLIANGGNAKSLAFEAIRLAKKVILKVHVKSLRKVTSHFLKPTIHKPICLPKKHRVIICMSLC